MSNNIFMFGNLHGSKTPYGDNTDIGKYVDVGDAKMYYEVYGDDNGKPLLLLHGGLFGTIYEVGCLIDLFRSSGWLVICPNTRGHGRSEIGSEQISYEQKAKDMMAVVDSVTTKNIHIFGFSDGGYAAYKIASMYPERVEKVITVGAGTIAAGLFPPDAKLSDFEALDKPFIERQRTVMPEPDRWQSYVTQYMSFYNKLEVGKEFLSTVKCPVLVMAGELDDHAPLPTVIEAYQFLPNSQLCIIPNVGHQCFLFNTEMAWNAIFNFFGLGKEGVQATPLLKSSQSWNDAYLPNYPTDKPEIQVIHYKFPAHAILSRHHHVLMSGGFVKKGQLTLISEDGTEKTFYQGDAFLETVDTVHYGENRGDGVLETVNFYLGGGNKPLSIPKK
ncbi:alpha/beta-hydrolase [Neocallimastix lanati (nom. inval.)]|uniref:Alpha/beta-hydrolase n=1 Tax=Neocallimastix californiae TaxID=1754190 RepID=A0A1Y2EGZ8_9FUNG|nr:alpha/beta-hydrolase [Neocallimastix sp. JGI-2020a]ORY70852.1 alpha/beta-hydrolase [Neocallimastix californiae]|eukprot:ORY70852.1 alpha/beta-hydrolase [Neocallimastix californiae]